MRDLFKKLTIIVFNKHLKVRNVSVLLTVNRALLAFGKETLTAWQKSHHV